MARFQKPSNPTIAGTSPLITPIEPTTDGELSNLESDNLIDEPTTDRLTLLKAARDRQEKELADLQAQIDELSDEFANRAESIVRLGLQSSYIKARQRIGAIDLSFFGDGAELPHSNNLSLMSTIEAEVTA